MTDASPRQIRTLGSYLRDHWQGRQSLAWSFWVNLVLLRAAILGLDRFTRPPFVEDPATVAALTVVFFAVCHLAVFAWQIVGVVRACDAYQSNFGASGLLLVIYLAIAAAVALTLVSAIGAFLRLFQPLEGEPDYLAWERARAARYELRLDAAAPGLLHFAGSFELGVTRKLAALLDEHPGIRAITLDSPGGQVFEGRGVAMLVQQRGLDTYVFGRCNSACTTAFIAGRTRSLGPHGRLGFHQHWLDADYPAYLADPAAEMQRDLEFYAEQGVTAAFRERVFVMPREGLWFPTPGELLTAGVVHRIDAAPPPATPRPPWP